MSEPRYVIGPRGYDWDKFEMTNERRDDCWKVRVSVPVLPGHALYKVVPKPDGAA